MIVKTIEWRPGPPQFVRLIDQTRLPHELAYVDCADHHAVADAIRTMVIRGAPAIGVAAAFGMALAGLHSTAAEYPLFRAELQAAADELAATRPTAVNLTWALRQMQARVEHNAGLSVKALQNLLIAQAMILYEDDIATNRRLGQYGADWLARCLPRADPLNLLTHCNAGALATAGYGTALGVVRAVAARGRSLHVWVDETRPWLQGARLTAWELVQERIPATLIADNMAAVFMRAGRVDAVIVGADRIARNGDVANKIGTYGLAVLAHHHGVPFLVAAPVSTIDVDLDSGAQISIEERSPEELTNWRGQRVAAADIDVANPVFDVTPHSLVSGLITEMGVLQPPFEAAIETTVCNSSRGRVN